MSRQLKFRQPIFDDKGNFKSFHYWGLEGNDFIGPGNNLSGIQTRHQSQQYTEMDCDNGDEIFDGDIVDGVYHEGYGPERISFNCRVVVFWDDKNGKWACTEPKSGEKFDLYDYEPLGYVVGNIYQKPSLL